MGQPNLFYVSTSRGLEEMLEQELKALGIENMTPTRGGVEFKAKPIEALRVILYSRLGSRVYQKISSFFIRKDKDIYRMARRVPWDEYFKVEQYFSIKTLVENKIKGHKLTKSPMHLSLVLKDSIADHFREKTYGKRPNVSKDAPDFQVLQYISECPEDKDKYNVTLYQDLTGSPLFHRGYRTKYFEAPMKENLAAALAIEMKVDQAESFIDGMTGSGTVLIEAALIKHKIPASFLKYPQYKRKIKVWDFQRHRFFMDDSSLQREFDREIERLDQDVLRAFSKIKPGQKIQGFDIDPKAVSIAKTHINGTGLGAFIKVDQADITDFKPEGDSGVLFCNPPYGVRLAKGEEEKLKELYYQLGENFKENFEGWSCYVFTSMPELRKRISLKTSSRTQFYNGQLDSRLVGYQIY